jgi:hypothetical protein
MAVGRLGRRQNVSAQGLSQAVPITAQPLYVIAMGPKRAHTTSTTTVTTRLRAKLMGSSFSDLKGITLIEGC